MKNALIFVVFFIVVFFFGVNEVFAALTPFLICSDTASYPTVGGDVVAWQDFRNGNVDIYGKNLLTMEEFEICTNTATQGSPSIDNNFVAWVDGRNGNYDIYGKNLLTGEEIPIDLSPYNVWQPDVSGNIVVWHDFHPAVGDVPAYTNILGKNWVTGEEFVLYSDGTTKHSLPVISGDIVVWGDFRNGNIDIYGKNIATSENLVIYVGPGEQHRPSIDGNIVVWQDSRNGNSDIYGKNLITGEEFVVCDNPFLQSNPNIGGNYVTWWDTRNGNDDIYGYNLLTKEEFPVYVGPGDQFEPKVNNLLAVWESAYTGTPPVTTGYVSGLFGPLAAGGTGGHSIYGAYLGNIIPEPATLALIAPALLGFAGVVWRRRLRTLRMTVIQEEREI
jgi:beta propeller repeat protein